jgi:hypothetical protein
MPGIALRLRLNLSLVRHRTDLLATLDSQLWEVGSETAHPADLCARKRQPREVTANLVGTNPH